MTSLGGDAGRTSAQTWGGLGLARGPITAITPRRVELRELTKRYGPDTAVDDLSLSIAAGESVALFGPSGCGKSTTLRMIAGLIQPNRGSIMIGDQDMSRVAPQKRGVGVVFQDYALFPHMTVRKNIEFGLRCHGWTAEDIKRRVRELLELMEMAPHSEKRPRELSGGMQQRVALARALAPLPGVILLDEPFSAVDAVLRAGLQEELRTMQRDQGVTMIYVTHDQSEALALSDRIAVMSHGRCLCVGTPSELYKQPSSLFIARSLGPLNRFDGVLAGRGEGLARINVGNATVVVREENMHGESVGQGPAMVVAVRPEAISVGAISKLREEPLGAFRTKGIVIAEAYLGARIAIQIECKELGTVLNASIDAERGVPVGSAVFVGWDERDLMAFAGGIGGELSGAEAFGDKAQSAV